MADSDKEATVKEPASLRALRRLVTVLMVVMIFGVLTVTGLMAYRLTAPPPPLFPESVAVPAGERVIGLSRGTGFLAIVTEDGAGQARVHIARPEGTEILQTLVIEASP